MVTEDWYFWSHRLSLARAAKAAGFEVVVATRTRGLGEAIAAQGLRVAALSLRRSSRNPARELAAVAELYRLYRRERPAIVHHVAAKPVIYGSLAARAAGVPAAVNALAGLGFAFVARGPWAPLRRAALGLAYRAALAVPGRAIFQNEEDAELFASRGWVARERIALIRGSGVDCARFAPTPEPPGPPLVVLVARLLWDKGVGEFVEAARRLRREGLAARFALVGTADDENPAAVPASKLAEWEREGAVEIWGPREDMPAVYASAHVACLPSYREGLPKALLEAAACARALAASDVPGCREIARHGETALLVPARDPAALAGALRRLIEDPGLRRRLGARAREVAAAEFSEEKVISRTLALYREVLAR